MDYKNKYLKYKLKYINFKNKLIGGTNMYNVDTEFPISRDDLIFGEDTYYTTKLNKCDLKLHTNKFSNYVIWLHSSEPREDINIQSTLYIPNDKPVFHRYYAKKHHCGFANIRNLRNDLNHKSSQDPQDLKRIQQEIMNNSLNRDNLGNRLGNKFEEVSSNIDIELRQPGWDAQPVSQLLSQHLIADKHYSGDSSVKDNAQFPHSENPALSTGKFTFNEFFSDENINNNGIKDSEGNIITLFGVLHINFDLEIVEVLQLEYLKVLNVGPPLQFKMKDPAYGNPPHPIGQNCHVSFTKILKAIIHHNETNNNTKPIFIHDPACRLEYGKTDIDQELRISLGEDELLQKLFGLYKSYTK